MRNRIVSFLLVFYFNKEEREMEKDTREKKMVRGTYKYEILDNCETR